MEWSCGVCGKRVQADIVQCTVCKNLIHKRCSGVRGDLLRVADGLRKKWRRNVMKRKSSPIIMYDINVYPLGFPVSSPSQLIYISRDKSLNPENHRMDVKFKFKLKLQYIITICMIV